MREALQTEGSKILDALRELAYGIHAEELDQDGNLVVVWKKPAKDERTRLLAAKFLAEMLWGKARQTIEVQDQHSNLAELLDAEDRALLELQQDKDRTTAEALAAIRRGEMH